MIGNFLQPWQKVGKKFHRNQKTFERKKKERRRQCVLKTRKRLVTEEIEMLKVVFCILYLVCRNNRRKASPSLWEKTAAKITNNKRKVTFSMRSDV
jgi:hypothetical protein